MKKSNQEIPNKIKNFLGDSLLMYIKFLFKKEKNLKNEYLKIFIKSLNKIIEEENIELNDVMLYIFAFTVIAIDPLAKKNILGIKDRIRKDIKDYYKHYGCFPGDLDWFYRHWKFCNAESINNITTFFNEFFKNLYDIFREDYKVYDNLFKFSQIMEKHCMRTFRSPFRDIVYSMMWQDVINFIRSEEIIDINKCTWLYKDDKLDYDNIFILAMLGLILFHQECEKIESAFKIAKSA